jgi:ParB family chromosome partitioning protein
MARRSGLGKGLSALIPPEVGSQRSALREVPISSIRPNSLQPRAHFDEEAMSSLAASIRELGLLQPVLVREMGDDEESYELIAGERRWRAARRAGLQTIPVLVRDVNGGAHSLEQALVENLHREDLGPLEEAAAYQQLIDDFGLTHEQVATRVGKGRATVTNTLRLLQLPAGAQRALADGSISAGHARALLGTPDRTLQEGLVGRIVSEGLTVRQVEDAVRAPLEADDLPPSTEELAPEQGSSTVGATHRQAPRRLPEPGVLELEELLSTHLNTRVKVELRNRRGRVVVEFATLEDLERIYRAMVEGPASEVIAGP